MIGRRRGKAFWVLWAAAAITFAGCGMTTEQRDYTIYGAVAGAAIGGGIGGGVFAADNSDNWPAVPAGIVGGAIIGGIIGYLIAPPPPPPPEKIILRGVHFDFDKSNIRPEDAAVLDEAAETLKSHPNVSIAVNGYCDAIGSVRYNLRLSERRSNAVVKYLADHGVAESRMTPHGFGKTDFVATNKTAEGRAQNRRVELIPNQ